MFLFFVCEAKDYVITVRFKRASESKLEILAGIDDFTSTQRDLIQRTRTLYDFYEEIENLLCECNAMEVDVLRNTCEG